MKQEKINKITKLTQLNIKLVKQEKRKVVLKIKRKEESKINCSF